MAMISPSYQLKCDADGCGRTGPTASTPGEARTRASGVGFKVVKYPSTDAACPDHLDMYKDN